MRLTASWAYYFTAGFNPIQVLQFIASGFYGAAAFSKGNFRRLGWSPRPFCHRFRGHRHLRRSNPVSAHAKQGGGNVGHDVRHCGIHCYELCLTTAHSRRETTLVFAALAERSSRARFLRWLTDRFGSPTHYKPFQLQYSGGLTEEFMKALVLHSWPGNVRELQNLIERSVILSTSAVLRGSLVVGTALPSGWAWPGRR